LQNLVSDPDGSGQSQTVSEFASQAVIGSYK